MYIEELLKEADKSMENYKYEDALVYLKSVLEIDENNYSALMTLSKIYSDFGMFEQAKEYAEKLQKKYPDSKDTLFTLGFVYQSLGRLKKAIALYKKFGFKESGRNPRGFCSRYTGWQELIYMLLELD